MDDFVNAIAYEVKQEIANRYFGFRSQIETEIEQYLKKLHDADREHLTGIRADLMRMRFLLHKERLFKDFLFMAGLPQDAGDGSLGQSSPDAAELFAGLKGEGFSRWRRYRDLAFKVYRSLADGIVAYRATWVDLDDEYAEICTMIDDFHRNNDLSGILSFLRTFDSSDTERLKFLHADSAPRPGKSLDQDLRIPHPRPVADILPDMPALPPLKQVTPPMSALLKSAYAFHDSPHTILPL